MAKNYKTINKVNIYSDGHWSGRNLSLLLLYADRNHKKLPWEINRVDGKSHPFDELKGASSAQHSVLAIVKHDLNYVELIEGNDKLGGCFKLVKKDDFWLLGFNG